MRSGLLLVSRLWLAVVSSRRRRGARRPESGRHRAGPGRGGQGRRRATTCEVTALALPTQDPHFVDARPHLALELARADLLIAVGPASSRSVGCPRCRPARATARSSAAARAISTARRSSACSRRPRRKVDRAMGDIHPRRQPALLYDPRRVAKVAAGIGSAWPSSTRNTPRTSRGGAQQVQSELERARKGWEKDLAAAARRQGHRVPQVARVSRGLGRLRRGRRRRAQARHPAEPQATSPTCSWRARPAGEADVQEATTRRRRARCWRSARARASWCCRADPT